MSNQEIVKNLAQEKVIESIVQNMNIKPDLEDDLIQDAYIILLEYDNHKLEEIYKKNQLRYFIARILCNQAYSVNSPFWKTYRKFSNISSPIQDVISKEDRGITPRGPQKI